MLDWWLQQKKEAQMGRILLVEDDDSIRFMITQMLSHFGHETVAAENGLVALNVLTHDTAFDAVITDLRMPVIDGIRLTMIIKADYPGIPVIATSVHDGLLDKAANRGTDHCLQKPFTCTQLLASLPALARYSESRV
jgi:two-component system response regulator MprA